MTHAPAILLVDSNVSDGTLTRRLRRELPNAEITVAREAAALTGLLGGGGPDVAVIAADLGWADPKQVIGTIRQRAPATAIVLVGDQAHLLTIALYLDLAVDGLVQDGGAGPLDLGATIDQILAHRGHAAATATPARTAPTAADSDVRDEPREVALLVFEELKEAMQEILQQAYRARQEGLSAQEVQQIIVCGERARSMLETTVEQLEAAVRPVARTPVDLNACVRQALANLRSLIDESGADIRAARLPMSVGDEPEIVRLFQHLVSSAIDFCGATRPAVTIHAEPRGDRWLLVFRGNGSGVQQEPTGLPSEPTPSRRADARERGAAIGLALCRQIAERQGGRLWAESRQGLGSALYVLLARAPAGSADSE